MINILLLIIIIVIIILTRARSFDNLCFNVLSPTSLQSAPTWPKLVYNGRNFEHPIVFQDLVDHLVVTDWLRYGWLEALDRILII